MMATIQLFLDVVINRNNPDWYEQVTSALKRYCATEQVEVVKQNESKRAQIEISYELSKASLNEIESIVVNSGASITAINIHLPTSITGFADPYHASGVSLPLKENLKTITGILGGGISSNGEVKIELDPSAKDKQKVIEEVLRILPLKTNNS